MNVKLLALAIFLITLGEVYGQADELEHAVMGDVDLRSGYGRVWTSIYGVELVSLPSYNDTLQQLIDNAVDGDTIELQPGWYISDQNSSGFLVEIDKNLTLKGQGMVIIDGRRLRSALAIGKSNPQVKVKLSNIKLINCKGETGAAILNHGKMLILDDCLLGNNIAYNGSSIYNKYGEVWINDSLVTNNFAMHDGTVVNEGGKLIVENSTFSQNIASMGSGISSKGAVLRKDSYDLQKIREEYRNDFGSGMQVIVRNCTISYNRGDTGGAISSEGGSLIIDSTSFESNRGSGGAIYAFNCPLIATGCKILNSKMADNCFNAGIGASVFIFGQNALIENCSLLDNEAMVENLHETCGTGGGIYASESNVTVDNCDIRRNKAFYGGGINVFKGNLIVNGGIISDNVAKSIKLPERITLTSVSLSKCTETDCERVDLTDSIPDTIGGDGGGIFIIGNATLNDVTIERNYAARKGGAIYIDEGSQIRLDGKVTIIDNQAKEKGGAIYNRGTLDLRNAIISNNCAKEGGGIFIEPLGNQLGNTGLATNNTPDNIYSPAEVE